MKIQLKSEGVKESDIKTLEQRLFLVRLYRNTTDPEGRLGEIENMIVTKAVYYMLYDLI